VIVLKNIDMTLDPASIERAIRIINDFEAQLKPAMQCLIDYLGAKGVEVARAELIFFNDPAYQTGALSESLKYRVLDNGDAEVTAGEGLDTKYGSYAMFVEYGTGFVGEQNPNPQAAEVGYAYDLNRHGAAGWYYPAPWGWVQAEDGQMLAWTQGMAPRPFMANTLHDLEDEARVAGATVIAEYLRGERA